MTGAVKGFTDLARTLDEQDTEYLARGEDALHPEPAPTPAPRSLAEPTEWSSYVLADTERGWAPRPSGDIETIFVDREFARTLRASVKRRLKAREICSVDSDDVHQEIKIRLLQQWDDTPIEDIRKYVYGNVLRTVITNYTRETLKEASKKSRLRRDEHGQDIDPIRIRHRHSPAASPVEEAMLRKERIDELRKAKESLAPRQREVVEGLEEQGLSRAELAHRLGIGVGALSTHRHRALAKLRDVLENAAIAIAIGIGVAIDYFLHQKGWVPIVPPATAFGAHFSVWVRERRAKVPQPSRGRKGRVLWYAGLCLPENEHRRWFEELLMTLWESDSRFSRLVIAVDSLRWSLVLAIIARRRRSGR